MGICARLPVLLSYTLLPDQYDAVPSLPVCWEFPSLSSHPCQRAHPPPDLFCFALPRLAILIISSFVLYLLGGGRRDLHPPATFGGNLLSVVV